ncbi:hypothetical protein MJN47_32265, partial [Salmonella enterica subsp. enterica serovar Lubbock]|nr:hypothetical protein [Salmonella enterica subsp. enterica serovar Lubbock]
LLIIKCPMRFRLSGLQICRAGKRSAPAKLVLSSATTQHTLFLSYQVKYSTPKHLKYFGCFGKTFSFLVGASHGVL